jgi:hypothetical protein
VLQPQRALWRVPQPCTQRGIAVRGGSGRRYEGLIVQGAAVSCRLNVTKREPLCQRDLAVTRFERHC